MRANAVSTATGGQWQVFVYPENVDITAATRADYDVTVFRNTPTEVISVATTDPFGPSVAQIRFPKVTVLDKRGQGDLWWCLPDANVDIYWVVDDQVVYAWEGYTVSFEYGEEEAGSSLSISCVGAMRQMDNILAKPEYLYSPITFENAILRQFANIPSLRLAPARVRWPSWWTKTYTLNTQLIGKPWMIPQGIANGQNWSGMLTRYTGQFEQLLSGYIQQLLSSMYTQRGQFTLLLERGRKPVLQHRDHLTSPNNDTLYVDLLWPGVSISITEDHSQKLNTVFVTGKTLSGVTYSGMQVSNDGKRTTYEPYAARKNVHPLVNNRWLDTNVMRKEVQINAADGMSADEAHSLARTHLQRFSDPGLTGTLTLKVDPIRTGDDYLFPRQAITAGMNIQVRGLFGEPDGRLFHIVDSSCSGDGTLSLTIDSKFRDQLTVQEVRLRGRDSLTPTRMLTTGNWQPNVSDMLFPWSYDLGAGYIPFESKALFRGIGTNELFPWQNWTKAHPPKDPQWRDKYIHIGPKSSNADENWSTKFLDANKHSILLSAAGTSRMIQLAAYDEDGNVMDVGFHFSIWYSNSVDATATPKLPAQYNMTYGYPTGQYYPFFPDAWETLTENGVMQNPLTPQAEASASIIIGWGNYYEKAGYWPRSSATQGTTPTGMLVDEVGFTWDMTQVFGGVNPQEDGRTNSADVNRAMVYCLVYCDEQLTQDVYFLGRIYRAEPGAA